MALPQVKKGGKRASTPHVLWDRIPTHSTNGCGVLSKEGEGRQGAGPGGRMAGKEEIRTLTPLERNKTEGEG